MKAVHGIGMIIKKNHMVTSFTSKTRFNIDFNIITVVPPRKRNLNAIVPDSNDIKTFFDMHCDICKTLLSSLQHAKLHYLEEHNIPDGYIKVRALKTSPPFPYSELGTCVFDRV